MENQKNTMQTGDEYRVKSPNTKTKTKKHKGTTLAIVSLSVLLMLSLVFGITAAFFSANAAATGNVTLGNPVNVNITQGGTTVSTITFDKTAMPGTVYSQPISVSLPTDTSDAVIRGKLTITNSDTAAENVTASTDSNWVKGDDNYYYFNGVMSAGDSQDFVTSITVPKTLTNADANKTFAISVQIEAIQHANGAASEVWTTAPQDWLTTYGSATTSAQYSNASIA